MPNDIVIQLWHHGGHWCLKKRGNEYWHKSKADTEWKAGLAAGNEATGCGTGLSVGIDHLVFIHSQGCVVLPPMPFNLTSGPSRNVQFI